MLESAQFELGEGNDRPPTLWSRYIRNEKKSQVTMIDFSGSPVVDNHCHPMDPRKASMQPEQLAGEFYHGIGDLPKPNVRPRSWDASPGLWEHFPNMGVVQTLIIQLSQLFDCEPELEVVAEERNRHTSEGLGLYAKLLYDDAGIVTTVVDSGLADDDPAMQLFPGTVLRVFQMDPTLERLFDESDTYSGLLQKYLDALDHAVRVEGRIGVKSHLAELFGFGVDLVSDTEAEQAFTAAKSGDRAAYRNLYVAAFTATLTQCQELQVPVHLDESRDVE